MSAPVQRGELPGKQLAHFHQQPHFAFGFVLAGHERPRPRRRRRLLLAGDGVIRCVAFHHLNPIGNIGLPTTVHGADALPPGRQFSHDGVAESTAGSKDNV